jgi:hypothetical protein
VPLLCCAPSRKPGRKQRTSPPKTGRNRVDTQHRVRSTPSPHTVAPHRSTHRGGLKAGIFPPPVSPARPLATSRSGAGERHRPPPQSLPPSTLTLTGHPRNQHTGDHAAGQRDGVRAQPAAVGARRGRVRHAAAHHRHPQRHRAGALTLCATATFHLRVLGAGSGSSSSNSGRHPSSLSFTLSAPACCRCTPWRRFR